MNTLTSFSNTKKRRANERTKANATFNWQPWSREEEAFVLDNPQMTYMELATALRRTRFGVRMKAIKLRAKAVHLPTLTQQSTQDQS